jgi:hypothetical protein
VAKRSKRNQFRPIFTKGHILTGTKRDFMTANPRPAPTRGLKTKRRKRQQKKKKKVVKKKKRQPKRPEKDPTAERRKLASATVKEHGLLKKYRQVVLTVGSIQGRIRANGGLGHAQGHLILDTETKDLSDRLRWCVSIINMMQLCAYEVIALDICHLLGPSQGTQGTSGTQATSAAQGTSASPAASISSRSSAKRQHSDLDDLLDNDSFYHTLGTLLLTGQLGPQHSHSRTINAPARTMSTRSTSAGSRAAVPEDPHVLQAYKRYATKTGFKPFNSPGVFNPDKQSGFPASVMA